MIEIQLTPAQASQLNSIFDQVVKADANGSQGIVLAQIIDTLDNNGNVGGRKASCQFVPHNPAMEIIEVLENASS